MLDPCKLLEEDDTGLRNASRLAKVDKAVGVLRLSQLVDGSEDTHFLLDKDAGI